ncbi:uncharacterized protein [Maniola hyperantus]|uniref:uncharacterized protein n=1 Tax=Aphantopus hyperantus TaxID=2795564 RepID=UPI00156825A0|nr:skin secretory protein xP2-like [Maniola hyperantus]
MPPPPLPQRRATRPRPIRRKVFVRSTNALDAIIASGQVALAARAAQIPEAGPASSAGEESFAVSPLALSPAPSTAAVNWPSKPRAAPQPKIAAAPTPQPRAAAVPQLPAPAVHSPSPRAPRFPAPPPSIAVGRFPSPPQRRGEKTTAINMPALSPDSPMDTVPASEPGTSYAATAATKKPRTTLAGTAPVPATAVPAAPTPAAAGTSAAADSEVRALSSAHSGGAAGLAVALQEGTQ